jgi:hypothetical protein
MAEAVLRAELVWYAIAAKLPTPEMVLFKDLDRVGDFSVGRPNIPDALRPRSGGVGSGGV